MTTITATTYTATYVETLPRKVVFPATDTGRVLTYLEVYGVRRTLDHQKVLEAA